MNGINPVNSSPSFGMAHRVTKDVQEYAMGLPKAKNITKVLDKFASQSVKLNAHLYDVDTYVKPLTNGGEGFVGRVFYVRGGESADKKIITKINPDRSVASNLRHYYRDVQKFIKAETKARKLADKRANKEVAGELAKQRQVAEEALNTAYDKASKEAAVRRAERVLDNRKQ